MKSGTIKITEDLVEARMHAGWVLKFLRNHERLSREYGEEIKIKDHHIHEIFDKTDEALTTYRRGNIFICFEN